MVRLRHFGQATPVLRYFNWAIAALVTLCAVYLHALFFPNAEGRWRDERFDKGAAATDTKRPQGFETSSPRPAHGGQAIRSPIRDIFATANPSDGGRGSAFRFTLQRFNASTRRSHSCLFVLIRGYPD
jgi:hypothetical protein